MRDNIDEEDPPPWVNVREKLFSRSMKGFLDEKLLKRSGDDTKYY